ncbi:MAG TPA: retropepsin-like aspartic protease [Anaerolineae bacterium]|nr:retropepsin-like aspartic protease [Anaerolineae bacterium]HMR67631.1 retropepsin-like aspartic protease [Anaerolineae bacterium]
MKIKVTEGLPFVTVTLVYQGKQLTIENVLLDTGSAGSIFSIDQVDALNLLPEPTDKIEQVRGVGGIEYVFTKRIDLLRLGSLEVLDFEIEVGAMKYGFDIDGIIGLDFLMQTKAIVDLSTFKIYSTDEQKS